MVNIPKITPSDTPVATLIAPKSSIVDRPPSGSGAPHVRDSLEKRESPSCWHCFMKGLRSFFNFLCHLCCPCLKSIKKETPPTPPAVESGPSETQSQATQPSTTVSITDPTPAQVPPLPPPADFDTSPIDLSEGRQAIIEGMISRWVMHDQTRSKWVYFLRIALHRIEDEFIIEIAKSPSTLSEVLDKLSGRAPPPRKSS